MKKCDFLIIGAGLFGSVFAYEAKKRGNSCLIIEKRPHIAGNIYSENRHGIEVHKYGAHIFHTSDKEVWDYVQQFTSFNHYINSPLAFYQDKLYNLPFNMNTFYQLWGTKTPQEAKEKILEQQQDLNIINPQNLEEQALSLVGTDIYEKLIKDYTEKQWGCNATELPAFIIKRLPLRFTFNNNYFNDTYQGIPIGGYTKIVEKMLEGIEVRLNTDYFEHRRELDNIANTIVFTGVIDQFYDYCYGTLDYRSLKFETELLSIENYQGNAVVNYTEKEIPYTRIIEHKHFEFGLQKNTIITKEYPASWSKGDEPYYPINNEKNNALYTQYKQLADKESHIIFGGRLAHYQYYDMHQVIASALSLIKKHYGE